MLFLRIYNSRVKQRINLVYEIHLIAFGIDFETKRKQKRVEYFYWFPEINKNK